MSNLKLSLLAEGLTTRSVNKLSELVDKKNQEGEKVYNFTLGDFLPNVFPIPEKLEQEIINGYLNKHTNYSYVGGVEKLRTAIANHLKFFGQFDYQKDEIIAASGARPLIYLLFQALLDPKDKIIYTVPSWNTQYFIYMANAEPIVITTKPQNDFLITPDDLKPHLKEAVLININSPLNPGGTIMDNKTLKGIFDLIVAENEDRIKHNKKPLYIFFDIIYWLLIYNEKKFTNPIKLNPKIRDYVIFIDGISKCFAATGVRVGWAFGPKIIIEKMRNILSHIGAWAPQPEQVGTANFLADHQAVSIFLEKFKKEISTRLNIFYDTMCKLKERGLPVDAIKPQGALYLSLKLDILGAKTPGNKTLSTIDDVLEYLIDEAKMAVVPFHLFGMEEDSCWYRLSVGTCSIDDARQASASLTNAMRNLIIKGL